MTGASEGLSRFGQVRIRLAGIDVEIQLVFVAWLAILALASGRRDLTLVTWIVVAGLAVLIHELGHAFAYRAFGVQPRIVLSAVFGLTFGDELPPARSLVVSLAGPATGIALGVVSIGLAAVVPDDGLGRVIVEDLAFVGFGWAVLNVLPIQPLDGGQAVRAVIAAAGWRDAERIALIISIVAAAMIGIAAIASGYVILVLFMAWFAAGNVAEFQALGDDRLRAQLNRLGRQLMEGDADAAIAGLEEVARKARSRSVREAALTGRAFALLSEGRADDAERDFRLLIRPQAADLLSASIALHHGRLDPDLAALLADHPDAASAMGSARAILDAGRLDEVLDRALALPDDASTVATRTLLVGLHFDGEHDAAVRVGELLFNREPTWNEVAYFVASSLAALGHDEEALTWLARSAELGAGYFTYIDGDRNLARIRGLPDYGPIHDMLVENAAGHRPNTGALLGDAASDVGGKP